VEERRPGTAVEAAVEAAQTTIYRLDWIVCGDSRT